MDKKTLHKLSYGMYVICSKAEGKYNGQIANTVFQITSEPATIAVSINKSNLTHSYIQTSKELTISIIGQDADMSLIGTFGFRSGRDIEKFKDVDYDLVSNGVPIIKDGCLGYIEGQVIDEVDVGTHTVFIVGVEEAEITGQKEPMTYAFYHQVKKGKSPQSAPTYIKEEKKTMDDSVKYVCSVCGYVYDPAEGDPDNDIAPGTSFEELPDDWVCPVCGVGKDEFEKEE